MLIRFEVANFRSILDPVELTMVAIDQDRPGARAVPNINESLLPVAAMFGPNASGKSNIIAAMTWLRVAVLDSLRFWDDAIPIEPFAFANSRDRGSDFTLEAVIGGVRFEYVVEVDREAVRYEALFHYPEKKRRRVFEREGATLTLQRGLKRLSGTRELLTDHALVLSAARLGSLAEFAGERVRRSQNLERAYLHGRFGALPDIDRTEVLRALGLIG